MAPRRHRSTSNAANVYSDDALVQRTQSPATQQRQHGLSPVIYENNLKVLRRREPSITSIFDQFSHVCVYHYHANKWEKQGYEGSMFLFEKYVFQLRVICARRDELTPGRRIRPTDCSS